MRIPIQDFLGSGRIILVNWVNLKTNQQVCDMILWCILNWGELRIQAPLCFLFITEAGSDGELEARTLRNDIIHNACDGEWETDAASYNMGQLTVLVLGNRLARLSCGKVWSTLENLAQLPTEHWGPQLHKQSRSHCKGSWVAEAERKCWPKCARHPAIMGWFNTAFIAPSAPPVPNHNDIAASAWRDCVVHDRTAGALGVLPEGFSELLTWREQGIHGKLERVAFATRDNLCSRISMVLAKGARNIWHRRCRLVLDFWRRTVTAGDMETLTLSLANKHLRRKEASEKKSKKLWLRKTKTSCPKALAGAPRRKRRISNPQPANNNNWAGPRSSSSRLRRNPTPVQHDPSFSQEGESVAEVHNRLRSRLKGSQIMDRRMVPIY